MEAEQKLKVTECCAYCGAALEENCDEGQGVHFCSTLCEMRYDCEIKETDDAEDMLDDNGERFETDDEFDEDDVVEEERSADWEGAR